MNTVLVVNKTWLGPFGKPGQENQSDKRIPRVSIAETRLLEMEGGSGHFQMSSSTTGVGT